MLEGGSGAQGEIEEETLMMSMLGGSSQKKKYNKEEFGSNLSVVKFKPQERQSMMNDSIWSGMTSIKHDFGTQPKLSQPTISQTKPSMLSLPKDKADEGNPEEEKKQQVLKEDDLNLLRDEEMLLYEEDYFPGFKNSNNVNNNKDVVDDLQIRPGNINAISQSSPPKMKGLTQITKIQDFLI